MAIIKSIIKYYILEIFMALPTYVDQPQKSEDMSVLVKAILTT